MKTLEVHGQARTSRIIIGESLRNLKNYAEPKRTIVVADSNLKRLYGEQLKIFNVIEIEAGEKTKNLDTVRYIYKNLLDFGADRYSFVVGVGGGVVCDITGFAASTYMRGVPFGFVASTLLAQVDAGVGGKNGVNFEKYKNMIGVFSQPHFVLCDIEMLQTLPARELTSGFAECVKHALIGDRSLFDYLEGHRTQVFSLKNRVIEKVIYDSIRVKARIVEKDEYETGERRKLNLGHTFAHALESTTGLSHGEAVSIGIAITADLSVKQKLLTKNDASRIKRLLINLGLPNRIALDGDKIMDAIKKDKKRDGSMLHFVLLKAIGRPVIRKITIAELEAAVHDMC